MRNIAALVAKTHNCPASVFAILSPAATAVPLSTEPSVSAEVSVSAGTSQANGAKDIWGKHARDDQCRHPKKTARPLVRARVDENSSCVSSPVMGCQWQIVTNVWRAYR